MRGYGIQVALDGQRRRVLTAGDSLHINVMRLDDITSCFYSGLAESAAPNGSSECGLKTHHILDPKCPFSVKCILFAISKQFDPACDIVVDAQRVMLVSNAGLEITILPKTGFLD